MGWIGLVVFGAGVLLIRLGVALYLTGLVRSKNAAAMACRVVADVCVAVLAFWAVGWAIAEGNARFLLGAGGHFGADGFLAAALVLIATAVPLGAMAERTRFFPSLAASAVLGAVVVPLAGQWVWSGWLGRLGAIDVAGAAVIHIAGACAGLAGAILAGPRTGKYNTDGSSNTIPGHNLPLAAAGVLAMLAGWAPYVASRAGTATIIGDAAGNVLLAAAAGGFAGVLFGRLRYGKPDVYLTFGGMLAGLVSVTAGGGLLPSWAAVLIGLVAGFIVPWCMVALDLRLHVDDPASLVSIQGIGAVWGLVAAGLLVPAPLTDRLRHLGANLLAAIVVAMLSTVLCGGSLLVLRTTIGLRLREADEYDGSDLAEHDLNAYPDFQQTMIKSYHLREA